MCDSFPAIKENTFDMRNETLLSHQNWHKSTKSAWGTITVT